MVKKEGVSISAALRMAWRSFKLAAKMKTKAVHFAFRKVDGTIREAVGTLADEFIKDRELKATAPNATACRPTSTSRRTSSGVSESPAFWHNENHSQTKNPKSC